MYGKIFESIYDGTLAESWQALVTFQQMLVLCTADGVVDMTPAALHRRTGIPLDIIQAGIAVLEQPDPLSRTPDMDGRRIARLDPKRPWGWFIVNYAEYRKKVSAEEKKESDRLRIAAKRAAERGESQGVDPDGDESQSVAGCSDVSRAVAGVANVAHATASATALALRSVGTSAQEDSREIPVEALQARTVDQEKLKTPAEDCAEQLEALGVTHVNPTHARLTKLLADGVPVKEIVDAAREMLKKGVVNLAFVCATVAGRRADAASQPGAAAPPPAAPKQNGKYVKPPPLSPEKAFRVEADLLADRLEFEQITQDEHDRLLAEALSRMRMRALSTPTDIQPAEHAPH